MEEEKEQKQIEFSLGGNTYRITRFTYDAHSNRPALFANDVTTNHGTLEWRRETAFIFYSPDSMIMQTWNTSTPGIRQDWVEIVNAAAYLYDPEYYEELMAHVKVLTSVPYTPVSKDAQWRTTCPICGDDELTVVEVTLVHNGRKVNPGSRLSEHGFEIPQAFELPDGSTKNEFAECRGRPAHRFSLSDLTI